MSEQASRETLFTNTGSHALPQRLGSLTDSNRSRGDQGRGFIASWLRQDTSQPITTLGHRPAPCLLLSEHMGCTGSPGRPGGVVFSW